ncbi:MAG: HDOD domain-containing protein [Caldimonas sp.]
MAAPATSIAATETGRPFGRFALQRVLGEGAHATVWLGFDQRLEREVAVKLMRSDAAADPVAVGEWLREARSVSRLTHPNIVPVFEADVHREQPYLVFEYVPGPTLAQLIKARGALPAHEAASLMLGVLDALHAAHGAGVVHRDLKPSNVLVGPGGRARVMDFGIAAQLHDPLSADLIVGTPGYMSPEATQGGLPTAAMDLFSVGLMLAEALSGRKLIAERDPYQAMRRVANEDLALPEGLSSEVNDVLRSVLRRALERDPARRWQSAAAFREALQGWLVPEPAAGAGGEPGRPGSAGNATLDFLLRRMRHKSDFPAMSDSVARIQRIASLEGQNLANLAAEILKDVALTNKLLRLVNTVTYSTNSGTISTVSRAIALVGFAGIRNMAMSVVLLEHMHDKVHASQLQEEFLRSLLAGMLAGELCIATRDSEEAFIGAMFLNLGRLVTEFYLPDEARQIRGIVSGSQGTVPVSDGSASAQVLGLSFEALGMGVAKVWGLPADLQACMRKPVGAAPARPPVAPVERMRWLALAANQVADALFRHEPDQAAAQIAQVAKRYAGALGVSPERFASAAEGSQRQLAQRVEAMSLQLSPHSPARRLFTVRPEPEAPAETRTLPRTVAALAAAAAPADATIVEARPAERPVPTPSCDRLAQGVQDIADALAGDFRLNDILRMILGAMHDALALSHVVFCVRDARGDALTGRFGLGEGSDALVAAFSVPLKAHADLFTAVCLKGADALISHAASPSIAARLPAWYRQRSGASAFLLLPVLLDGAPIGLIYADRAPAGLVLAERELKLLRTLRNQGVLAFRQAGSAEAQKLA